jgi:hypothetical protein
MDMSMTVQDILLDLVRDVFEIMANAFDPSVRWDVDGGNLVMDVITSDNGEYVGYAHELPDDVFLNDLRDKAVDVVASPLFGMKMRDGVSSPLANKVEEVMLYLPEDNYPEDI